MYIFVKTFRKINVFNIVNAKEKNPSASKIVDGFFFLTSVSTYSVMFLDIADLLKSYALFYSDARPFGFKILAYAIFIFILAKRCARAITPLFT
jgi:hypothetical protein